MRKKSHISLARYIVGSTTDENLKKHRLSFYVGSVLPDIKPSFLYRKHEMTGTYPDVKKSIDRLVYGKSDKPVKNKQKYYLNLGQVTHYVADYFTYPHNKIYPGSLRDHCAYEEQLKRDLRSFLKTDEASKLYDHDVEFDNTGELFQYIENQHKNYLELDDFGVNEDIHNIVTVNQNIVTGISKLLQQTRMKKMKK